MIKAAHQAGCSAVKFQLFKIESLFTQEIIAAKPELKKRIDWELPKSYLPELSKITHDLGMEFCCTPFYLHAVEELSQYVDFLKIASYELLWHDLFKKCAETGLPLVFSTGMSTYEEIVGAIGSMDGLPVSDVTVLRCTSSYPTPFIEANLQSIETLQVHLLKDFPALNPRVGWSDHTVTPGVIYSAVFRYGAEFVEFHIDLDGQGEEFNSGHCWLPSNIGPVIKNVQEGLVAEGSGDISPIDAELIERDWRADPGDGLRPLQNMRNSFHG